MSNQWMLHAIDLCELKCRAGQSAYSNAAMCAADWSDKAFDKLAAPSIRRLLHNPLRIAWVTNEALVIHIRRPWPLQCVSVVECRDCH